jgi:hypothetical protein
MSHDPDGLSQEELEQLDATVLPSREAMSVIAVATHRLAASAADSIDDAVVAPEDATEK